MRSEAPERDLVLAVVVQAQAPDRAHQLRSSQSSLFANKASLGAWASIREMRYVHFIFVIKSALMYTQIVEVVMGGIADKSGVKTGYMLVEVNGQSVVSSPAAGLMPDECQRRIAAALQSNECDIGIRERPKVMAGGSGSGSSGSGTGSGTGDSQSESSQSLLGLIKDKDKADEKPKNIEDTIKKIKSMQADAKAEAKRVYLNHVKSKIGLVRNLADAEQDLDTSVNKLHELEDKLEKIKEGTAVDDEDRAEKMDSLDAEIARIEAEIAVTKDDIDTKQASIDEIAGSTEDEDKIRLETLMQEQINIRESLEKLQAELESTMEARIAADDSVSGATDDLELRIEKIKAEVASYMIQVFHCINSLHTDRVKT